ncbi:stalk domain-containing protein [Paenibacillus sp.]|uniref:stalk domain-containing protein n=1 Tax=Paenibacillus sp. TaxID=58172 RepID=UPI002D5976C1|nr:stalk domain-containing protein [Paenibacillus sp.]HZG86879.1 stalk domain-containing protein [Paenibacillus sp.]
MRKTLIAAVAATMLTLPAVSPAGAEALASYVRSYNAGSLVKTDGTLWTWGGERAVPTPIHGLTDVAAAYDGGWIVKNDGTVWVWEGTTSGEPRLDPVPGADVLREVAGDSFSRSVAIDSAGRAFVREWVEPGVFGAPGPLEGIEGAVDVSRSRQQFYLFVLSDGTVKAANDDLDSVETLAGIERAKAVDGNLVLKDDGTVWEVSRADADGWESSLRLAANRVEGLNPIQSIAGYDEVRLAIDARSGLWFWGATRTGASDGTIVHEQRKPVQLSGIADVKEAVHVERSIVALTTDGDLYETSTSRESMPADAPFRKLAEGVVSLKSGGRNVIFQKADGTLWGWGVNKGAALGAGSEEFLHDEPVPVQKPISISLNGRPVQLTNGVMLRDGLTFVPLRSVFTSMGAELVWDHATKSVAIRKDGPSPLTIVVDYEKGAVIKNGTTVVMAEAPFISSGTSYLPLRFVSESLGAKVDWYADQYHIAITTGAE